MPACRTRRTRVASRRHRCQRADDAVQSMSPVAPSGNHAGRALAVATVSVIVLMGGLFLGSLALSSRKSSDLHLGDTTFQGGGAARLAAEIDQRGPIFYGDVSGEKDRDIILQHLGSNSNKGWYAFLAAPTNKPRACTWEWQKASARLPGKVRSSTDGAGQRSRVDPVPGHRRRRTSSASTSMRTRTRRQGQARPHRRRHRPQPPDEPPVRRCSPAWSRACSCSPPAASSKSTTSRKPCRVGSSRSSCPGCGVWWGAFVSPDQDADDISAAPLLKLEHQIGRRLAIVHRYHDMSTGPRGVFPDATERAIGH